jgi:hypothetical protein
MAPFVTRYVSPFAAVSHENRLVAIRQTGSPVAWVRRGTSRHFYQALGRTTTNTVASRPPGDNIQYEPLTCQL